MKTAHSILLAFATAALVGCGGDLVRPIPGDDAGTDASPTQDVTPPPPDGARVCVTTADCAPGEECLAHEGCDTPSYCGPALGRPCTDDIATFCGCDGMTFFGSSTCPPRSYRWRGPCESSDAGPPQCRLPNGSVCPVGRMCPAGDGCNSCLCNPDGTVACTRLACIDAGPPPVCRFPDGRTCAVGQSCPAGDGCNTCVCGRDGSLACTERACVDAGPAACTLPDGRVCPQGQRCMTGPCSACTCRAGGQLVCEGWSCPDAGPVDVVAPRSCRTSSDCPPSMICDGAQGCDVPWVCVPARPCTADLAPFCGCDGRTFQSSSSCPGQQYRSRGACPDAGTTNVCRAQDARAEGLCDLFLGVAWNGRVCVSLGGCRCVGADCGSIVRTQEECVRAHATCPAG